MKFAEDYLDFDEQEAQAEFESSLPSPFELIEMGVCPECHGRLTDDTGYCEGCHLIPALNPEYQTRIKGTKVIAGHELTLIPGRRYIATRPMASRKRRIFPVTIAPLGWEGESVTIAGLDYDQANALINAFNDGETSWEGRVW